MKKKDPMQYVTLQVFMVFAMLFFLGFMTLAKNPPLAVKTMAAIGMFLAYINTLLIANKLDHFSEVRVKKNGVTPND